MRLRISATVLVVGLALALPVSPARAAKGHITLLGQLLPAGAVEICDVWGYVDPNGVHYAILGAWHQGVYIINVEDPAAPFLAKAITGSGRYGFDVTVWEHYIYACSSTGTGTLSRVYDISDISNPIMSAAFPSHHSLQVHPDGFLYGCLPALTAYDIRTTPMAPAFIWAEPPFGDGHDSTPVGSRLYDFHGYSDTYIWDITDRASPVLLGSIVDPNITYNHSGFPTPDGHYLYICDELALNPSPDVTIWDISNPALPARVGGFGDPGATIHNIYLIGGFAFASHYSAGFRVWDTSNPVAPLVLDTYDTAPARTGENYNGCYGAYPFADNGVIYVSDFDNGLFLFSVEGFDPPPTAVGESPRPGAARVLGNYPNPFNPSTTIAFELDTRVRATLSIYDARGVRVATLLDEPMPSGRHEVGWDGRGPGGERVASGVYFARLTANGRSTAKRMVLLK